MTLRYVTCALLAFLLLAGTSRAGQDALRERLDEANGWLADRARWNDAIEVYREALHRDPTLVEVRIRLARVLAWDQRYDEALTELDVLIAAGNDPGIRVERAEIYSWAGRTEEAERDFDAVLALEPDNARAYRGLARVFAWSDRKSQADRTYRQALALEENEEARKEWDRLRRDYRPFLRPSFDFVTDSIGFDALRVNAEASLFLDLETRLYTRAGWLSVEHDTPQPELLRGSRQEKGRELAVGIERRLSEQWSSRLFVAGRSWRDAPDRLLGEVGFDYSGWSDTSIQLMLGHRDQWEDSLSLPALRAAIQTTYARVGVWRQLGERSELYGSIEGGRLTDGNRLLGSYLEVGFEPLEMTDARLVLTGNFASYHRYEDIYYSPELDGSFGLLARKNFALMPALDLRIEAGGGYGGSKEFGAWSTGVTWTARSALEWKLGSWALRAEGTFNQSQRATTYRSSRVGLQLKRSF